MKMVEIVCIVTALLMVLMMVSPTFAINGPLTQNLQYKFFDTEGALWTALLNNDIDLMAWPLTSAQATQAMTTPGIAIAPYFNAGYEVVYFNNNATDAGHTNDRKALNYTEFRQAMACLVDKDGLIAGSLVNGQAFRTDTQVPRPNDDFMVNFNTQKLDSNGNVINKYPWDFNETHALQILWTNNWYSHTTYPTLASLLSAFASGPLPAGSVVYPTGHPRAGTKIDALVYIIRADDPIRKSMGENHAAEITKIGASVNAIEVQGSKGARPYVMDGRNYDLYTGAWIGLGAIPNWFYSFDTPIGIYVGGANSLMVYDDNMTYWAQQAYGQATTIQQSIAGAQMCQAIETDLAIDCPVLSTAQYMAYRTTAVGVVNVRGTGISYPMDFDFMNIKVPNSKGVYAPPMTIRYGPESVPDSLNPIFSSWLFDTECNDRMFTYWNNGAPYNLGLGKTPVGGITPWMAYDWKVEVANFTAGGGYENIVHPILPSDTGSTDGVTYLNCANCTYYFRHDIKWSDGVPFTVDDFNFTLYVNEVFADSWVQSDMSNGVNFIKWDNWTCSIYYDVPSFYALYMFDSSVIPKHLYENIRINATDAQGGASTTMLHGVWPGADATADEYIPNPYFTNDQLHSSDGGKYMWVGTNMWEYVPGTFDDTVGGGMVFQPNPNFWMNITQGEMDFYYTWNSGAAPQGGSWKVALSDLVLLANAYGTTGTMTNVPFKLGGRGVWEPGCNIAPPGGKVGLADLVTLALNYGKSWGGVTAQGIPTS